MIVESDAAVEVEATVDEGVWTSSSAELVRDLNMIMLPDGYFPDHDLALSNVAIETFGGEIVEHEEIEMEEGVVY
jgi:hypothetical protein